MSHSPTVLLATRRFSVVGSQEIAQDGRCLQRAWIHHPGAVTIVPRLDDDRVCLIRNHRVATGKTLIELPAGTLEPGEPPAETARRELIEETGYRAGSIRRLHAFFTSPGILDERMVLFVAEQLTPGASAREPGERIENLVVPFQEALAMIDDGRIEDAKTLVGLLVYERMRRSEVR